MCYCELGTVTTEELTNCILPSYIYLDNTGIDDLNEIFRKCKAFSNDWKFIGLELGVKKTTLDIIDKEYFDVKEMMLEMLASWLKRQVKNQPVPSWNVLLTAISEYSRVQALQIASKFVCKHV